MWRYLPSLHWPWTHNSRMGKATWKLQKGFNALYFIPVPQHKGTQYRIKGETKVTAELHCPSAWMFFFCKYLLQDEIKHQNEAIKIHFIILTVKVNCLSTGVSKVLEGTVKRTTYWTPKRALERTWERTQHVVLNSAPRVRSNAYLKTYKINMSKWMLGI